MSTTDPEYHEDLPVGEDPDLLPEEKQVSLTTTKRDTQFTVHSEVATVTRWLVEHPAVEITNHRVVDGEIVAVTGTLPRGMVNLAPKPRKIDHFSAMLSTEQLRDREVEA